MSLRDVVKEQFPNIKGELFVKKIGNVLNIHGSLLLDKETEEEVLTFLRNYIIKNKISMFIQTSGLKFIKNDLSVVNEGSLERDVEPEDIALDEVEVIYFGMLQTNQLIENNKYKIYNANFYDKIYNIFKTFKFFAPIIINKDFKVIDGDLRLKIAKELKIPKVPVMMINTNVETEEALRLLINRLSEFQRWEYEEIDPFVDSIPFFQPLMEPVGFFGKNILPTSFFAKSMENYNIDIFNKKQSQYKQDTTLSEWAEIRRQTIEDNKKEKNKKRKNRKSQTRNQSSLFDLKNKIKEKDFLPTYDINKVIDDTVQNLSEVAADITDYYDEIRREILAAEGKDWQSSRRNTKQLSEDTKNQFLEEYVLINDKLTNEDKIYIITNYNSFGSPAEMKEFIKELEQKNLTKEEDNEE